MSEGACILDSSVVIRHFRNGGEATARLQSYGLLYLPSVALGELYAGAYRSARPEKHLTKIDHFLEGVILLPSDEDTARHFGLISAQLAAEGQPIPQNDIWIAACAMQWNLKLATCDKHFQRIEGLVLDHWPEA